MSFVDDIVALVATSKNALINSPPAWDRVPLGRVAKIVNGYPFPSGRFNRDKGHPVVRIRDVVRGRTETFYDGPEEPSALIDDGDLLVGMDGDFNSAKWRGGRALLNQRVCKVVPNEEQLHPGFLRYLLPGYLQLINQNTPSTTVKHLSSRTLAAVPIPVPSPEVQARIAARIDELFAELDDGEEELRRARVDLETCRKALLNAAVTGELTTDWRSLDLRKESGATVLARISQDRSASTLKQRQSVKQATHEISGGWPELPVGWEYAPLESLLANVQHALTDGPFGSKLKSEHYRECGPRVIRLQNIGKHGQFVDERAHISDEHFASLARHQVQPGDLVVAILGDTAPRAALVPDGFGEGVVKADCFKIRLSDQVGKRFVWAWLNSGVVQSRLSSSIKGVGRPRIGMKDIRTLPIPIPPTEERMIIEMRLAEALEGRNELLGALGTFSADSAMLRQAILAAAFRGELVS